MSTPMSKISHRDVENYIKVPHDIKQLGDNATIRHQIHEILLDNDDLLGEKAVQNLILPLYTHLVQKIEYEASQPELFFDELGRAALKDKKIATIANEIVQLLPHIFYEYDLKQSMVGWYGEHKNILTQIQQYQKNIQQLIEMIPECHRQEKIHNQLRQFSQIDRDSEEIDDEYYRELVTTYEKIMNSNSE